MKMKPNFTKDVLQFQIGVSATNWRAYSRIILEDP